MHFDLDQQTQAVGGRLRRLPDELQPPFGWQEFQQRSQRRWPPMALQWGWKLAAAAILVVIVAAAVLDRNAMFPGNARFQPAARFPAAARAPRSVAPHSGAGAVEANSAAGATEADLSRAIETWLAGLPDEPIVVRVETRAAVAGLEDRIAQVDDILTAVRLEGGEANRLARLQEERTRLMGSLAQVRYAEAVAARYP